MRLIDADALLKVFEKYPNDMCTKNFVFDKISNAPTIVPIIDTKSCGVSDLISRQLLIGAIEKCGEEKIYPQALIQTINALPSAEPKWITDRKPTEDGTYMVTLDAFGLHRFVDILIYGKPIMPNRKVRGKCWYRSDSEWGDVVYDDDEILAWMPLPTPYGEENEE